MLSAITVSHVFVADQDQALDFYVGKLGLEVSNDQDLGFMRWLTGSRARAARARHSAGETGAAGDGRRQRPASA